MVSTEILGTLSNSQNVYASAITFDGANFLSVYNDFTAWNPQLAFGGVTTGITYALQTSSYVKIGRVVFVTIQLVLTSKGAAAGNASILGLPFTVINSVINNTVIAGVLGTVTLGAGYTTAWLNCVANTTTADVGAGGTAVALKNLTNADFANNSSLYFTGFYFAST
jgi:hypothetical protein